MNNQNNVCRRIQPEFSFMTDGSPSSVSSTSSKKARFTAAQIPPHLGDGIFRMKSQEGKEEAVKRVGQNTIEFVLKNGNAEGEAKETISNGDITIFNYFNNKRHGNAIQKSPNGDFRRFQYVNDLKEGEAFSYILSEGYKETYRYTKGIMEGNASYTFANKDELFFSYSNNEPSDQAILKLSNGTVLQGDLIHTEDSIIFTTQDTVITYKNKTRRIQESISKVENDVVQILANFGKRENFQKNS